MRTEYYTYANLAARIKEIREMQHMLKEREAELIGWYNRLSYEDDLDHKVIDNHFRVHALGIEGSSYNDTTPQEYLPRYRKRDFSTERELH